MALHSALDWRPVLLLALASLAGTAVCAQEPLLALHSGITTATGPYNDSRALVVPDGGDKAVALKLCECERATGPPSGLSCDKQGWFISSFERQGQWVAGGGYVPLSHAICCRPCLPDELPPDPSGRIPGGQAPLAVISLGCHASTDTLPTRCELGANSFVSGYSEAAKVFTTPDSWYPINSAQCCTSALLLGNGDAWELERCGCHDSHDPDAPTNCGGTNTDELLMGYIFFRLSPMGHVVPVGPAQCCRVCLSSTVHPMNDCDDLKACSGHGVCNMRRCECFDGWAGADCSQSLRSGRGVPPWAIALIVLSSSVLAGMLMVAAGYVLQALGIAPVTPAGSEDGEGEERQPLLIRIDADDAGSVGSDDTSGGEDDVTADEVERRVHRMVERLEHSASGQRPAPAAEAAAGSDAGGGAEVAAAAADGEAAAQEADGHSAAEAVLESEAAEAGAADPGAPTETAAAAAAASTAAAAGAAEDEEIPDPVKPPRGAACGGAPEGPLAMVDCSVCMSRPVQVVVVPCGHVCMCRRCSRRLNRCPMCRREIARRQRLFV